MKTRFSALVTITKSVMQKSERVLESANTDLNRAKEALKQSHQALNNLATPNSGVMMEFLASRILLDSSRNTINHNKEWVSFANNQVENARVQLKSAMLDYEKVNYLQFQEVKKIIDKKKIQEAKDLDEVALMTYSRKKIVLEK